MLSPGPHLVRSPERLSVIASSQQPVATVVLFPGDISAARADMLADPQLRQWSQWSCEDLCRTLATRWPGSHIAVVHPPRSVDGTSMYDGWVPIDDNGDPLCYERRGNACCRLLNALLSAEPLLSGVDRLPLNVVAFSHGAVVLNQIVAEIGSEEPGVDGQGAPAQLANRAMSLVWLDPGLAKEPGAGILGDEALARRAAARLSRPPRTCHLHVALTPYQLQTRSWWGSWRLGWRWPPLVRESDACAAARGFQRAAQRDGTTVTIEHCVMDRPSSLEGHFAVLEAFTAPWELRQAAVQLS